MSKNGTVKFYNGWGCTLLEVHIRHRRGDDPNREDSKSFYCVPIGQSIQMDIVYENFSLSDDYWWIKFVTLSGIEYQSIGSGICCNITPLDDGNVTIRIDPDTQWMYIVQSVSADSGCLLQKIL